LTARPPPLGATGVEGLVEVFEAGASYNFELMAVVADEGNQSFSLGEFSVAG